MKLVEILAREMAEWPKGIARLTQSCFDAEIYRTDGNPENDHWPLKNNFYVSERSDESHDHDYPIITREMWEAERARIKGEKAMPKANKDGWIRHRGGKCPVKDRSTYINGRFRSGEQYHGPAYGVAWSHVGKPSDIMAWRPHKPEQPSLSSIAADGELWSDAKEMRAVEAFAGPIQWRDRIREIDSERFEAELSHSVHIERLDHERASLVAKLKAEGFALIQSDEPNSAAESAQDDIDKQDMSDPANWRVGDLIECISFPGDGPYTEGKLYEFIEISSWGSARTIDDNGTENGIMPEQFKWHSRPTN